MAATVARGRACTRSLPRAKWAIRGAVNCRSRAGRPRRVNT